MKKSIIKNSMKTVIAALALCLTAACAPKAQTVDQVTADSSNSQIIGGVDSSADFQRENGIVGLLMVFVNAKGEQSGAICTGSLIKPNVVLTAAHCLTIPAEKKLVAALIVFNNNLEVALKELNEGNRSHIRIANKALQHESYMKKGEDSQNDVGLLRFAGDLPDGFKLAKRLDVAAAKTQIIKGVSMTLSGFGVSKYELTPDEKGKLTKPTGSGDGILRQVDNIKLLEMSEHELALDQSKGAGACHGDSGGPAYITVTNGATKTTYLVGVTSRGEGLCDKWVIYSNVVSYSQWIDTTVEKLVAAQ
ncbi:MAG: trypsin-like serine protease [Bdellovibrionaceae bacterium]|nr:trypsin-like serine protease [Bdellovibrio sp.]